MRRRYAIQRCMSCILLCGHSAADRARFCLLCVQPWPVPETLMTRSRSLARSRPCQRSARREAVHPHARQHMYARAAFPLKERSQATGRCGGTLRKNLQSASSRALLAISMSRMRPRRLLGNEADSTRRSSQAVPHPSTNRALCRLTSEVRRDPVYSTRYGRQQTHSLSI